MNKVEDELKSQFYAASLGFYKSFLRDAFGGRAEEMVRVWNEFAIGSEGLGYKGGEQGVPGLLAVSILISSLFSFAVLLIFLETN